MKQLLSTALALVCAVLVIILIVIKNTDSAQHESDAGAINDLSNQLTSAQSQITVRDATILTISNNLSDAQSALLVSSNHVVEAESTIVSDMEQITNLNQQ